jgi:hypothetical protein
MIDTGITCACGLCTRVSENRGIPPFEESRKEDVDECLLGLDYEQRWEVISAFLEVLEKLSAPMGIESDLPHSKERIRLAIFQELVENPNSEFRDQLEIAYMQLEVFIPYDDYKTITDFKNASLKAQEMTDPADPTSVLRSVGIMKKAKGDRAVKIQEAISEKMMERIAQIRELGVTARVMGCIHENPGQAYF